MEKRTIRKPGGRPKTHREITDLARSFGRAALRRLDLLARTAKSETARISANIALLDRGFGKPKEPVELTGADGRPLERVQPIINLFGRPEPVEPGEPA